MSEKLHTIKEVAEYFRVSDRAVKQWVKDGSLEHYKVGRLVRISEEHVQKFLASNKN
ncbi:helix-turn-helix domain-containing protein [Bacillus sp. AFS075034]|uniref:helix-turn-helix domain-containing protein n=1 Tax=Bacillus sp. AFS075034 TaxID=2034281 RepID=UPI00159BA170|nr:helix-turn-helix domain-containing protein [Bacillus sp. AFS075034]